jgi:hypothetical protein
MNPCRQREFDMNQEVITSLVETNALVEEVVELSLAAVRGLLFEALNGLIVNPEIT